MTKRKLGNPPISPYHHKTEMPGVPGHHRLSEIKSRCYKVKSSLGHYKACFRSESAWGDGVAKFTAFDSHGNRRPDYSFERKMTNEEFQNLMISRKGKKIA